MPYKNTGQHSKQKHMIKFDETERRNSINGALALRGDIEKIAEDIVDGGFDEIYFMGIGGTLASAMQTVCHIEGQSLLPVRTLSAGEYSMGGAKRLGKNSIVIFSSVSGTTKEIVSAVTRAKAEGARIAAFLDNPEAGIRHEADWVINYPGNEQLKLFMLSDAILHLRGDFQEYDEYNAAVEENLADSVIGAAYAGDEKALAWAQKHKDDPLHYFTAAGNLWGAIYSFAMCYLEEQHWMHTKSIHSCEFFHGTLEIIGADTPVTVYIGEDYQRAAGVRVADFLNKVNSNYTVFDSMDYPTPGIPDRFRERIAHHLLRAVNDRIDIHLEALTGHDMEIRRYYRKLDY